MAKAGNVAQRDDFHLSYTDEPHITRRKEILEKYPEIENLFGHDSRPVPYVLAIIASQLTIAYFQSTWSLPFFLFVAWSYGGTANHSLSLMTHELSHNLVFAKKTHNEYFGILCNVAMGVPSSTMFKRYHMEHHVFQGDKVRDVDIPTEWEGRTFRGPIMKALWLFLTPVFYAGRPMVMNHKTPRKLDMINTAVIVATDILIAYLFGIRGLLYLVASTCLGMGLHPVAGHFVAEHFVFEENTETYSYYGALNLVSWNVGYHNEHHDFPRVPGWKLPLVKQIASEFYDPLPQHKSYVKVLWDFITDPRITPFSRVVRTKGRGNKSAPPSKKID